MRALWCGVLWSGGALLAAIFLYLISALVLGNIAAERRATLGPTDYLFYACDNGVHVDIVLPAVGGGRDWFEDFPAGDFAGDVTAASHVALGWGARGFFASTKEWTDIRPMPVIRALFWQDSSVLHVTYAGDPAGRPNCRPVRTDSAGVAALFRYIDRSLGDAAKPVRESLPGYGPSDAFYQAVGRYSLFRTCNIWSAEALAESGQETAVWTPFSFQVMGLLPTR